QLKVRVGISAVGAVVEFAFATLIQHAETTFQALIETMVEVQREGIIAVGIVVAVGAHTAVRMVDAAGVVSAGAEAETRAFVTAGKPQAALPGIAAAVTQTQAGIESFSTGATREDLNDPANGVGTVDRRA